MTGDAGPRVVGVTTGRPSAPIVVLALAAGLSAVLIIGLGARMTFWGDEWAFWLDPPASLFEPNNEHWSTVPYLVYSALSGATTYLPFMVVLAVSHLVAASGLYVLAEPRTGRWFAVGLATLLLFLGSAAQDFMWAWQVGFVGSVGIGLWGLVALDHDRRAPAAVLLTIALATAGPALFMLGVAVLWRPSRWLAIPIVIYAVWYLTFGRTTVGAVQNPFSIDSLLAAPAFVVESVAYAMGGVTSLGAIGGLVLVGLLVAVAIRSRAERLFWASLVALIGYYLAIALVRSSIPGATELPRYVHPAAVLVLVMVACVMPAFRDRRLRLLASGLLAIAIAGNAITLVSVGVGPTPRYTVPTPYGCIDTPVITGDAAGGPTAVAEVPARYLCAGVAR